MGVSRIELSAGGPTLSRLAFGCMRIGSVGGVRPIVELVDACLEVGITTFDHADIYDDFSAEAAFGRAMSEMPRRRDAIELVTKCGIAPRSSERPSTYVKHYNTDRSYIVTSVERSLRALCTDRIDLLLIHRPDPLMDPDEVAAAFASLRRDGKVRHFGVSNFAPSQFDLLQSRLDFRLVTNQVEMSVVRHDVLDNGTMDHCQRVGIKPMIWSPLGGAAFTANERLMEVLTTIQGQTEAASIEQVALAWVLRHPALPIPIIGTRRPDRVRQLGDAERITLDRQQWFSIFEAATGTEVP